MFHLMRFRNLLGVQRPVYLAVRASPNECIQTLIAAARPSTQRLQDRNLFAEGRRYNLQASANGFEMLSTSKISWSQRRRTRPSALLSASYTRIDQHITRLTLNTRMKLSRLAESLLIPSFMTSILVYIAWPLPIITLCIGVLYAVSILLTFYTAKIEANDMIYFIEKVLKEEFEPADVLELVAAAPYVQSDATSPQEFAEAWEKFYREHQS
jgi:ABC-type bacteriocin/lantibiotic exporter with double-glycine peptidase domain